MGLSRWERRVIWGVLWAEVVLNFINGFTSLFYPLQSISPLCTPLALTSIGAPGLEFVRWFGAMNVVVGWLLFRTIMAPQHLPLLLEALCIGDCVYLASLFPFSIAYGQMPGIAAPYLLTVVMFLARLRLLLGENWAGVRANQANGKK